MSFGSRAPQSSGSQPAVTVTKPAGTTSGATSSAAQDRLVSVTDPQAALLTTSEDEQRKRLMDGKTDAGGIY